MRCSFLSVAVLAAAISAASPAFACKGKSVLFEDNFANDSNWGDYSQYKVSIADGLMKVPVQKGKLLRFLYQGDAFSKADICLDVEQLSAGDAGAGLIFDAKDYSNYYFFFVNPRGIAGVVRLNNNRWFRPVPNRQVKLEGKKFTLRVTLNDNRATAYINDQKFADFKVTPVEGGGFVGMEGDSGDAELTWGFSNLKVTDLP